MGDGLAGNGGVPGGDRNDATGEEIGLDTAEPDGDPLVAGKRSG